MATKLEWFPTHGLISGLTFQFAEGHWPGEIGAGIALNWDAFDLIEPVLASSCAEWTPMHRYGPLELSAPCLKLMVDGLQQPDPNGREFPAQEKELRSYLAGWLTERLDAQKIVSFLGV
ncbi:hypothetical protein [Sphingopyxis sp.]|uniref:hypothetical protein n=1 Tax=Sphingopyxis sp. TaxID=1908224 RepID=UPI002FC6351F